MTAASILGPLTAAPNDLFHSDALAEAVAWRRHLHRHPELGYEEHATADFVAERLSAFGLAVSRGLAGTGVVGTLTKGMSRRTIGLRADMDALLVQEETAERHASCRPGVMHACGHDGHTAILLAAARRLAVDDRFDGTIHFIFQPAEEGKGGARRMIQDGLFRHFPVDEVFALHNWPELPLGSICAPAGPVMAAADRFEIVLSGGGGHGAMPHQTADVLLTAGQLVAHLNTIVARQVAPVDTAVLSVTQVHGGQSHNVLPARATLSGTVRTFSPRVQDTIERALHRVVEGVASANGVTADVAYERYYPATLNDPTSALRVRRVAVAPPLDFAISDAPASLSSEDFGFMLAEVPGCYMWLGAGRTGENPGLHSSAYDFNDLALPLGAAFWVCLARDALRPGL